MPTNHSGIIIRPAREEDLEAAHRIIRIAFGTAAGAPDPETFFGDTDTVKNRWHAGETTVLVAEMGNEIVGANVVTRWGSFAFFGPFGIRPDLWDRGIAGTMMKSVMACLDQWGVRLAGLYTMSGSPKHIDLYQRFGFRPKQLTAVMEKSLATPSAGTAPPDFITYADLSESERTYCMEACRNLTDEIYSGLDPTTEISAIHDLRLGDTLILGNGRKIQGFAACHLGPGTEAGNSTCYIKFAAVRHNAHASCSFEKLLSACEIHARRKGIYNLVAGINTARREAYETMLQKGFRIHMLGVAMLRPDGVGFNRGRVFVVDDWR
jgi:predicted N-acetyltransferase YhbS